MNKIPRICAVPDGQCPQALKLQKSAASAGTQLSCLFTYTYNISSNPLLSPLRLPVPPSRHVVEVFYCKAASLLITSASKTNVKLCSKVWRFLRICPAQPDFAEGNARLVLWLYAHDPVLKRSTAQDFTTIVSESDLARQVRPLRSHSLSEFRGAWAGSPRNKIWPPLGSTLSMHG